MEQESGRLDRLSSTTEPEDGFRPAGVDPERMSMRGKIERALLGSGLTENISDQHLAPLVSDAVDAVLEAMREPTDLMGLGLRKMRDQPYKPGSHSASDIWRAMIDAAREE